MRPIENAAGQNVADVAGAIRAGGAYVEIFADQNPLVKGLNAAKQTVQQFGQSLSDIGSRAFGGLFDALGNATGAGGVFGQLAQFASSPAGMFAGLIGAAAYSGQAADALAHQAAITGIAADQLQLLNYAAEQADVGVEGLGAAIRNMQKAISGAAAGDKEPGEALAAIGLSVQQLMGLSPDEQLRTVARAIGAIDDPATKTAAAMKVLGKSGAEMLEFANDLETLEDRARELGLGTISAETVAVRGAFADLLGDVKVVAQEMLSTIGGAVIPVLKGYVETGIRWAVALRGWIADHEGLVQSIAKAAGVVTLAGGGFLTMGIGLKMVGGLIGLASGGFRLLGAAISGAAYGVSSLISAGPAIAAALVSPVGLATLAVAGLAVGYFAFTEDGQAAWKTFTSDMTTSWNGVVDAIMAGDLSAALDVIVSQAKLTWTRFWNFFRSGFESIATNMVEALNEAFFKTLEIYNSVVNIMRQTWSSFTLWAGNAWGSISESFSSGMVTVAEGLGLISGKLANAWKDTIANMSKEAKSDREQSAKDSSSAAEKQKQDSEKWIQEWKDRANELNRQRQNQTEKALQDELDAAIAARDAAVDAAKKGREASEDADKKKVASRAGALSQIASMEGVQSFASFSVSAAALQGQGGGTPGLAAQWEADFKAQQEKEWATPEQLDKQIEILTEMLAEMRNGATY